MRKRKIIDKKKSVIKYFYDHDLRTISASFFVCVYVKKRKKKEKVDTMEGVHFFSLFVVVSFK